MTLEQMAFVKTVVLFVLAFVFVGALYLTVTLVSPMALLYVILAGIFGGLFDLIYTYNLYQLKLKTTNTKE